MNRKKALVVISVLALVFCLAPECRIEVVDSAGLPIGSALHILSPINKTYTSSSLVLNVSFSSLVARNIDHGLAYSLDGRSMGNLSIVPHYPDHLSFQGYFTATVNLTGLSKGLHTITVYAQHNAYLSGGTQTQLDSATVIFDISDKIPLNELTQPVISDFTAENKTYSSANLSFNFTVDKALSSTSYCLDNKTKPISGWWNTPTAARTFNFTLRGLADGSHTLVAYAEDTFGNTGASECIHFVVDTTPPKVQTSLVGNKTFDSADIYLNFSVDELNRISYRLDMKANVSVTGNFTLTNLSNGVHNITLYAWDAAGNVGTSETAFFNVEAPEPLPEIPIAIGSSALVIAACLSVYFHFKKRK